jgi:hypothetical protein
MACPKVPSQPPLQLLHRLRPCHKARLHVTTGKAIAGLALTLFLFLYCTEILLGLFIKVLHCRFCF